MPRLRRNTAVIIALIFPLFIGSCSGGSSSTSTTPTSPTPAPSNPGTTVSQSGCAITFACPNADSSGAANPSTPTFDTVTLSNGGSSSCLVSVPRNPPAGSGPVTIQAQFTIRNAQSGYSWRSDLPGGTTSAFIDPQTHFSQTGSIADAGPYVGTVQVSTGTAQLSTQNPNFSSALNMMIVDTRVTHNATAAPTVAACGITIFGTAP